MKVKEKLVVKNFSVIDSAEIDIKRINILIGPQSTGKSIIAKLVYFFKTIQYPISQNIFNNDGKKKLNEEILLKFNSIFPEYLIQRRVFEVTYHYGDHSISITNKDAKSFKSFKISYSDSILKEIAKLKNEYLLSQELLSANLDIHSSLEQILLSISNKLRIFLYDTPGLTVSFIPAGRSFFANLEKNIFTLMGKSAQIDPMLIEFGSFYEFIREKFLYSFTSQKSDFNDELYRTCIDLLGGKYEYRDKVEYLRLADDWEIRLRDASSGQQEVAPLIISLLALSRFSNVYLSIEEPEAHIFPASQWKIVEIIALVYNILKRESTFFITTHSPYILSSFNQFIQANNTNNDILNKFKNNDIEEKEKEQLLKNLQKIIAPNKWINFEDVSVYSVQKRKCKDIRNKENMLIDANEIDEVSEIAAIKFDQMLEISYGE